MATPLYIEVPNQKGINGPADQNPIVPPDISVPGNYNFDLYYLDLGNPDTYHRYAGAISEMVVRQNGPATSGTFSLSFLGYTTPPLDINISRENLYTAFSALRSVGEGNVFITGNSVEGWIFEFIGTRAGLDQALIVCDASQCFPASNSSVEKVQIGGGANCKQRVDINQNRVAFTNAFNELNAGGPNYGWTTASALSTAGIPPSFWINPAYDIVLEVKLFPGGKRTGSDGVTTDDGRGRTANDGVTQDDGRGRSGTDGVSTSSPGRSGTGHANAYGIDTIYATQPGTWTPFTTADVGRTITGGHIPSGTTIISVGDYALGNYGSARLSKPMTGLTTISSDTISWTTGAKSGTKYTSASAAFSQADVNHVITGTNIPPGTTILSVTNATTIVLSNSATAIGSALAWTIVAQVQNLFQSATANFSAADLGHEIQSAQLNPGTTIATVVSSTQVTLSDVPLGAATAQSWTLISQGSRTYAAASGSFTGADVNKSFTGDNIPPGTVVNSVTDGTHVVLSQAPTAIGTGLAWNIIDTSPGAGGVPYIKRIQAGSSTKNEIQQIVFSEIPAFGNFSLQDGAGGSQPLATAAVPLDSASIEAALSVAYPGKGPFSVSIIAKSIFQVTFGLNPTTDINGSANFTAATTDIITSAAHGLIVGDVVQVSSTTTLPAGLSSGVDYYVIADTFAANTFKVSATAGGTAVNITSTGTGTHTWKRISQRTLLVNDSGITYDNVVLSLILVPGVGLSVAPTSPAATLIFDGDFSAAQPAGTLRMQNLSDGTGAMLIRQRFMQLRANWSKQQLNSPGPLGSYLIGEDGMEDLGGGVIAWDRVYATKPADRSETVQMQRPFIGLSRTYVNGLLTDIQLYSVSVSHPVTAQYKYTIGHPGSKNVPADSPAGTVIHWSGGGFSGQSLLTFNGFDSNYGTFYNNFYWSWSRRRWMGEIWEQIAYYG